MLPFRSPYPVSEDIVLGPPKTAFASAGRARGDTRTIDSPSRASFAANDEHAKGERQNFKDKFGKDATRENKDDLREGRPESLRLRRDDNERWSNARAPRTPYDENERAFRRNGDRDLGRDSNSRDTVRGARGTDSYRRTGDRESNGDDRRNCQGRGHHEPSWYREDENLEGEPNDSTKDSVSRDWRDKDRGAGRGQDRDWGRKKNHEPEWMDDPKPEEKEPAHTQEDFQKWKERMKASNAPAQDTPASPEPKSNHDRTSSGKLKGKLDTPLVLDSTFDGFFGMWGDTKKDTNTPGTEEQSRKISGKPSKFTGFFAPKPDSKPIQEPPQSAPLPQPSKDEDKEGFQRILKLLDQQQSTNSRNVTPFHEQLARHPPNSPPQPSLPESNPLEALISPQTKDQRPIPQSRDSEFLLRLMQQPQQPRPTQQLSPPLPPSYQAELEQRSGAPGLLPFSNLMISSRDNQQQSALSGFPPGFFPEDKALRKPGPQTFFDRPNPADNAMPPGLQRPPGLDHFAPQGPPTQQQQQQRAPIMQPPPGLPPLMRGQEPGMRGPNPNAFPPPPVMGGPPGPVDRGQGGPLFGGRPPPGLFQMGAPPGFMQQGFAEGGFGRGLMDGGGGFGEFAGRNGGPPGGGYQR